MYENTDMLAVASFPHGFLVTFNQKQHLGFGLNSLRSYRPEKCHAKFILLATASSTLYMLVVEPDVYWFGHYRLIIDYHMLSDLNQAGIYFTTISAENYVQLVSRIKSVKDKVKENKFC